MEKVKLGDVCERGSSNIAQKDIINNDGVYPIYGASGIIKYVDFYTQENEYIAIVKDGAGIGRTMILPAKSSIIGTMQYIFPKKNIYVRYLYYAIKSMNLAKYYSGVTIPHIYFKDYQKEQLYLPGLDMQKKIVQKLDKIQEIIDIREKQIEQLDKLIKSQFVEMFENCKNIELIGKKIDICRGASPRPINNFITEDVNGENWIKIGDASENSLYITSTKEKITSEGANKSRRVYKGDFILSNSMSYGRPYILGINGCVHDGWLIMSKFQNTFNELYLYYAIRDEYVQNQFAGKVNGATVKNLNSDLVKASFIKIPPIEAQNRFAEFVKQINKQKFEIQKSLEEMQLLQESLMNSYFGEM